MGKNDTWIEQPTNKAKLRKEIQQLTQEYLERGGVITVCPPQYTYQELKYYGKQIENGTYE